MWEEGRQSLWKGHHDTADRAGRPGVDILVALAEAGSESGHPGSRKKRSWTLLWRIWRQLPAGNRGSCVRVKPLLDPRLNSTIDGETAPIGGRVESFRKVNERDLSLIERRRRR